MYLELSGIFPSTSLILVFKIVAVTKPLASGIFISTSPSFFSKLFYLCCIGLCELKKLHQEFSFLNYLAFKAIKSF